MTWQSTKQALSVEKRKKYGINHMCCFGTLISMYACFTYQVTRNLNVKFSKKVKLNNLEFKSNPTKCTVQIQPNIYN